MLIIFTSLNHDEIANYWHWQDGNKIIESGEVQIKDSDDFHDDEDGWEADIIDDLLPANGNNIVLVHESDPKQFNDLKSSLTKAKVFQYSTILDVSRKLWSWDSPYSIFQIPNEEPKLPFDKLCWAIHLQQGEQREEKILEAKEAIEDFFKDDQFGLDSKLRFLHKCIMTNNYSQLLDEEIVDKFNIRDDVNALIAMNDKKSKNAKIIAIRDKLLN